VRGAGWVEEQEGIEKLVVPSREHASTQEARFARSGRPPAKFGLFQARLRARANDAPGAIFPHTQGARSRVYALGWRWHHADPSVPPRRMWAG